MRRTPMLAVVVASLLGVSGCAGFPQRLDWTAPRTGIPTSNDKSEPGRTSWWQRPAAEATATASNAEVARSTKTEESSVAPDARRCLAGVEAGMAGAPFPHSEPALERERDGKRTRYGDECAS